MYGKFRSTFAWLRYITAGFCEAAAELHPSAILYTASMIRINRASSEAKNHTGRRPVTLAALTLKASILSIDFCVSAKVAAMFLPVFSEIDLDRTVIIPDVIAVFGIGRR